MFWFLKIRANRATYWFQMALVTVLFIILAWAMDDQQHIGEVVLAIICIPRLHDLGRSGWWIAAVFALRLALLAPVLWIPLDAVDIYYGVVTLAMIAPFIVLGCLPGQKVANRFGEPPPSGVSWYPKPATRKSKVTDADIGAA